jgi:hypothetical protein
LGTGFVVVLVLACTSLAPHSFARSISPARNGPCACSRIFYLGAVGAPLALLAAGLLLPGGALYATRHRLREVSRRRFPYQVGSKAAALAVVAATAVAATIAALLVGI